MSKTVKDFKGVKCKTPAEILKENIARCNNNTKDNLLSNIHEIGLQYSTPTPGNGNCFFEAVSDQLKRLGLPLQNASDLRSKVIAFCKENPILKRDDGDVDIKNFVEGDLGEYLDRMSNDGEWADHVMVVYMAEVLKRDIIIVTSSPNADPDKNILCITSGTEGEDPILLGHVWEYHYQSLMPVPAPKLKEEEINFLRFLLLIFKVSPKIVKKYFDTVFPPSTLANIINQHQQTIIDLVRRRVITAAQEDILRAIPGTKWPPSKRPMTTTATSSEKFDLSLLVCLLRNIGSILPPMAGWDKLPGPNEKTDGAHLARIKFYRNQLAHATDHKIQTSDFQNQWKEVEEALVHLNGGQHIPEIDDILNYDLDEPNCKLQQELESLKSEFEHYKTGNLPKNIAENIQGMIGTWEKEDTLYFETAICKRFLKALRKRRTSHITVIGSSGNGKTALARHTALKLKKENQFEIIPVETPEQILEYRTNKNQVFVIDDVVGKYSVDLNLLKKMGTLE